MKIDLVLLKKIHSLICTEMTGTPDHMACNLGISKRLLHNMIEYMKSELHAPIEYSRTKRTYYYNDEWDFYIGDLSRIKSDLIREFLRTVDKVVKIVILLDMIFF